MRCPRSKTPNLSNTVFNSNCPLQDMDNNFSMDILQCNPNFSTWARAKIFSSNSQDFSKCKRPKCQPETKTAE
jgi:hypothetical protein